MKEGAMDNKIFGKKLKALRKSRGYTQQVLAELVGIDEKHLSRLENGKYFPTYTTLNKLLNVFDISVNELGIDVENIKVNDNPLYTKAMQILNTANNDEELKCYLEALKVTQKALKLK